MADGMAALAWGLGLFAGMLLCAIADMQLRRKEKDFRELMRAMEPPCALCGYNHRVLISAECIRFAHGQADDHAYPPQYVRIADPALLAPDAAAGGERGDS